MSVPEEKRRAVNYTREWLLRLLDPRYRPGWTEIRATASRLLRHYPFEYDVERAFGSDAGSDILRLIKEERERAVKSVAKETNRGIYADDQPDQPAPPEVRRPRRAAGARGKPGHGADRLRGRAPGAVRLLRRRQKPGRHARA